MLKILTANTAVRRSMAAAAVIIAATSGAFGADAPLWLRNAAIAPDGHAIAFTYMGDIYTVPATGGRATRVTTQTSHETAPVWSPDSRMLAFASDRHGNRDIFIVDAEGGNPRRLTSNSAAEYPAAFSADGSEIYYTANIQIPASSAMFPSARMNQLYVRRVDGSDAPRLVVGSPVESVSFLPDGRMVYQDVKAMENQWRKHHTSSITHDIWLYDPADGSHVNLTNRPGEDRNPVVSADGTTVTFLAERDGTPFNIYRAPLADMSHPEALTKMGPHPVRSLSQAADGTLAYSYNGELYTLAPGATTPEKVDVTIIADRPAETERIAVSLADGIPSPDGQQVAFVNRGDIFVTSAEHSSTRQITTSAAAESQPTWAKDGRRLAYTSLRDGYLNIYTASIAHTSDPNFSNATAIDERPLVADDGVERSYPSYSPDGSKLAFLQDRNRLMVMDVASGAVSELTDGPVYPYYDGDFTYNWSPDSRWIVAEVDDNRHSPYSDIAMFEVATGRRVNLSQSGYRDRSPVFAMDGNVVLFLTERYGMRNQASWGSLDDVVAVFLNRDAYDRYRLSEEDYALRKEVEKANKKKSDDPTPTAKAKKGKKASKGADSKSSKSDSPKSSKGEGTAAPKADAVKPIRVDIDGIEERTVRLTPYSLKIAGAWVDPEGENLYYLASSGDKFDLWKMDLRKREPKVSTKLDLRDGNLYPSPDGKTLWASGDKVSKIDLKTDKSTAVKASGNMLLDHEAERNAMFDHVYIAEKKQFYEPSMHGVDWDALTDNYRRFLPHINNNYDFAEMLSELLGELNVSHTGATFRGSESTAEINRTASLGLLYDFTYDGDGLKVDEIVKGGPFDNATTALRPGYIITDINDVPLTADTDYATLLNNIGGKKTMVSFRNPTTGATDFEVVIPISNATMADLLYDRWVKSRAAYVDSISGGRLGYVHIRSMDDKSFRPVYADALGRYNNREGLVIDIRGNGGGRLHEDIEVLFSGKKYFTQVVRGTEICDMPSRRYNKPTVMVTAENCYSNAHGTPWVYRNRGLGRLVGAPIPGTMTSVNWVKMQDPSLTFGIPVVGYRLDDGTYLENTQLNPDILIYNNPADLLRGEDAQLRGAVIDLLRQLDAAQ